MKRIVPVKLEANYSVSASDVFLTVQYGDGQIGGGVIKLQGVEIGKAPIKRKRLGKGPDLVGKKLLIKSVVADSSDVTNKMSVEYTLAGGSSDQVFVSKTEVEKDGDPMAFYAFFKFVKEEV